MGLFQSIFGGSSQKQQSTNSSQSANYAYEPLFEALGGILPAAREGIGSFNELLSGNTTGLDAFRKATGFDAELERGSRGITGNAAASGMLRSGGTGKALQNYGNQASSASANNYLDLLMKKAGLGLNVGTLLGSTGGWSYGTGTSSGSGSSTPGIAGFIGSILSDPRAKTDIVKLGEMEDGLGIYEWTYIEGLVDDRRHIGVMANEVADLRPWALGPVVEGYHTVNYGAL